MPSRRKTFKAPLVSRGDQTHGQFSTATSANNPSTPVQVATASFDRREEHSRVISTVHTPEAFMLLQASQRSAKEYAHDPDFVNLDEKLKAIKFDGGTDQDTEADVRKLVKDGHPRPDTWLGNTLGWTLASLEENGEDDDPDGKSPDDKTEMSAPETPNGRLFEGATIPTEQDLSLAVSGPTKSWIEAKMSRTADEQQQPRLWHDQEYHASTDDDEDSSPGEPTPGSEAWEYWEESPEYYSHNIDTEILFKIFIGPLDSLFDEWLGEACRHNGDEEIGQLPSTSMETSASDQAEPSTKRKRIDNEDEDPNSPPTKSRISKKRPRKNKPLDKLLACPYFKKDPHRHRKCSGFGFTKISYMKGHIYRKHTIPIYCPVCRLSFENVQLRDDHSWARNCEPADYQPSSDGITSEQRDWLHQRGPPNLSNEQHWFRIFRFLFPGQPLPRSAYNDTSFSEDLLQFRDFITEPTGQDVLLRRVRENPSWTSGHEELFRPDIVHGLNQLYWLWAASRQNEAEERPHNEDPIQEPLRTSNIPTNEDEILPEPQLEASLNNMDETSGPSTPSLAQDEVPRAREAATSIDLEADSEVRLEPADSTNRREAEPSEQKVDHDRQSSIAVVPTQIQQGPSAAFHGLEDATEYEPIDSSSTLPDLIQDGFSPVAFNSLSPNHQDGSELPWTTGPDLSGYEEPLYLEGFESLLEPGSSEDHGARLMDEAAAIEDWETFNFFGR